MSGKGKILSFTEVFVKSREFPIETPYTLVLVQLVEGGRLLGILDPSSTMDVNQDTRVKIEFRQIDGKNEMPDWPRIFFVPDV